jgi:hypothetical protein
MAGVPIAPFWTLMRYLPGGMPFLFGPSTRNEPSSLIWAKGLVAPCLRLFWHYMRAAASRTFWTAGSKRPIRMAMMAMTTKSSISVNAGRGAGRAESRARMDNPRATGRE